jgi:hypothetical protein
MNEIDQLLSPDGPRSGAVEHYLRHGSALESSYLNWITRRANVVAISEARLRLGPTNP